MATTTELLQGTLDLLILKAVSLGPIHGYGILLRIQQISRDALQIPQGSLYPTRYRLEAGGYLKCEGSERLQRSRLENEMDAELRNRRFRNYTIADFAPRLFTVITLEQNLAQR